MPPAALDTPPPGADTGLEGAAVPPLAVLAVPRCEAAIERTGADPLIARELEMLDAVEPATSRDAGISKKEPPTPAPGGPGGGVRDGAKGAEEAPGVAEGTLVLGPPVTPTGPPSVGGVRGRIAPSLLSGGGVRAPVLVASEPAAATIGEARDATGASGLVTAAVGSPSDSASGLVAAATGLSTAVVIGLAAPATGVITAAVTEARGLAIAATGATARATGEAAGAALTAGATGCAGAAAAVETTAVAAATGADAAATGDAVEVLPGEVAVGLAATGPAAAELSTAPAGGEATAGVAADASLPTVPARGSPAAAVPGAASEAAAIPLKASLRIAEVLRGMRSIG